MKSPTLLFFLVLCCIYASAQRYGFEQVTVQAVENPVYVAISPCGFKMLLIDQPRRALPQVKFTSRPYLESRWSAAHGIENINKHITSETRVDGFAFSYDNKYLYFAANFNDSHGGMDIYYCEIIGDSISPPRNIGPPVNTSADENFPSISGNKRTMFFTREIPMRRLDDFKTGELWMSQINDELENWNEPEKLNIAINNGGIGYSRIYGDNETIIYSRIEDKKEEWKIHWARRFTDIHWFLPVPFDTLSSKKSEISPNFCKQDGFLYYVVYDNSGFNSIGTIYRYLLEPRYHPKKTIVVKGKAIDKLTQMPLNINLLVTNPVLGQRHFLTKSSDENGDWEVLINAGNTYMFHFWKENYSHIYRLFEAKDMENDFSFDIELFDFVELFLNVYDSEEFWPLDGQIIISDKNGLKKNFEVVETGQGQFAISLPIGEQYSIQVYVKDYTDNHLNIDLSGIVLYDELIRDIELDPLKRDIRFFICDEETDEALTANIEIIDNRGAKYYPEVIQGKTGFYKITLREGEEFNIEVRGAQGFAFKHQIIDLDTDRQKDFVKIPLSPLTRKVPIVLNNIVFEFNSADLIETSHGELNRVVQLLNDNPEIYMEILAHTDDIGSDRYNNLLAEKRAESVMEYLVVGGIDANRLIARGYGKSRPLVPNTSDENRAKNRRVEMQIYDKDDQKFHIEERISN